jgi:hypothetical protein
MSRLREAISHEQSKREESGDESIGEISLHISMFQANMVICYRLVNGLSHLAVTTDRDYHIYAGKDALVITDWKLSAKKKRHKSTLSQMELACGWMEPMKKAADALHKPVDIFVSKKAKYLLFEGSDATTRALIAIAIGCDMYPGGAHNIGPSKVATYLHKDDGNLQEFVAAKTKLDTTIVDTFAWRKGQYLLQPPFGRSDQHFTTEDILTSAAIAKDRAGNERAVNVCKQSGVIKHGLLRNGSPEELDDSWMAWSFQANFMFRPVL